MKEYEDMSCLSSTPTSGRVRLYRNADVEEFDWDDEEEDEAEEDNQEE